MNSLKILVVIISFFCLNVSSFAYQLLPAAHSTQLMLSDPEMKEISDEFNYAIQNSPLLMRDPQIMQYIQLLGDKLTRHSSDENMVFFVIDDNTINAFAGPGGYIGINSGLVLASESESELASVLAHEIAHVTQKHYLASLHMNKNQRGPAIAGAIAAIALSVVNPALGGALLSAGMTRLYQNAITFTRENEKTADRVGIKILHEAGFDPASMIIFFQRMQQNSRYHYTAHVPPYLRTHPMDHERIADAMNRQYPLKARYANSVDYQIFRERIRVQTTDDPTELIAYYKNNLKKENPDLSARYGYALLAMKMHDHEKALKLLNGLSEQYPNVIGLQTTLIDAHLAAGYYEYSLSRLRELTDIYPDNYALLYQYINALVDYGQPQQTRKVLQQAIYKYPEDADLWQKLARAQAADDREAEAYFSRGQALLLQSNKAYALNQFKHALKLAQGQRLLTARITSRIAEIEGV